MDKYQKRYIAHQKRKQQVILTGEENKPQINYCDDTFNSVMQVMRMRRSRRIFNKKITKKELTLILKAASYAPSSCDRKAIELIESKKGVEEFVGGRGWIDKADKVILIYAVEKAYKSPAEKDFMPYLDAGFVAQNIYLITECLNIKCCFVNPNHTGTKLDRKGMRLCGAIALGK